MRLTRKCKERSYYKTNRDAGINYDENILAWIATLANGTGGTELQSNCAFSNFENNFIGFKKHWEM